MVPARGGSKGIPRKNLATVGGRSLIAHTAATVAELGWLDAAVLSTDDDEIAAEGRACGLDVPFLRPDALATDAAGSVEMWQHAWLQSERHYGRRFDVSILLQPTTPLRSAADVERTAAAVAMDGHRAATTVSRTPGHFVPEKTLVLGDDGCVAFYHEAGAGHSRRQTAPAYYYRNGLCYAVDRRTLVDEGLIVEEDCCGVVVDGFVVNIDEPWELELAEFLHARNSRGR